MLLVWAAYLSSGDQLDKRTCFSRRCAFARWQATFYMYDLIMALQYLHRRRVIHRDLKWCPEPWESSVALRTVQQTHFECLHDPLTFSGEGWATYFLTRTWGSRPSLHHGCKIVQVHSEKHPGFGFWQGLLFNSKRKIIEDQNAVAAPSLKFARARIPGRRLWISCPARVCRWQEAHYLWWQPQKPSRTQYTQSITEPDSDRLQSTFILVLCIRMGTLSEALSQISFCDFVPIWCEENCWNVDLCWFVSNARYSQLHCPWDPWGQAWPLIRGQRKGWCPSFMWKTVKNNVFLQLETWDIKWKMWKSEWKWGGHLVSWCHHLHHGLWSASLWNLWREDHVPYQCFSLCGCRCVLNSAWKRLTKGTRGFEATNTAFLILCGCPARWRTSCR